MFKKLIFFQYKIMGYIENLKPRTFKLITNNYHILQDFHIDFHIVIYYLSKNKCKIIIRRLDNEFGWDQILNIKLYEIECNELSTQILSIGSSKYNSKIVNIYTTIDLEYKDPTYQQNIPKQIIQTYAKNDISNILHLNSIYTFQELNPEYEYIFFNNQECRQFIKENFDEETLYYYDLLVPGAFKADFFRYCILYIKGGCYFDCKQILRYPLSTIISENSELLLCQDFHESGLFNAILISCPKNMLFLKAIQTIKYKIKNFQNIYGNLQKNIYNDVPTILSLTGPDLLHEVAKDIIDFNKNVIFKHIAKKGNTTYNDFYINFNNKHIITKNYPNSKSYGKHYSHLWRSNEIFFRNISNINDYKILFYPDTYQDTFIFYLLPENKILLLNKTNNYWNYTFKIKILDNSHNEFIINIPTSKQHFLIINTDIDFDVSNLVDTYNIINDSNNNKLEKSYFTLYLIKNNKKYIFIYLKNNTNTNTNTNNLNSKITLDIILKNKETIKKTITDINLNIFVEEFNTLQ